MLTSSAPSRHGKRSGHTGDHVWVVRKHEFPLLCCSQALLNDMIFFLLKRMRRRRLDEPKRHNGCDRYRMIFAHTMYVVRGIRKHKIRQGTSNSTPRPLFDDIFGRYSTIHTMGRSSAWKTSVTFMGITDRVSASCSHFEINRADPHAAVVECEEDHCE